MNLTESVATKVLKLVDKCFVKPNPLHKILNRNTVKVSYRTTPNIKQIISSHNSKVLADKQTPETPEKKCNCRSKKTCPLDGKCLEKCIVYQATVKETKTDKTESYIGLTADSFKTRYGNHLKSFNHKKYHTDTELSKHVWKLKEKCIEFNISWKIIDRGKSFDSVSRTCNLCTTEKLYLLRNPELCSLNTNNELGSYCRHQKRLFHSNLEQ